MDAEQLLNAAGLAMGLPQLRFDGNGCARLVFDGKIEVNFEHERGTELIQVFSTVAAVPAADREAFYAMLLQGNLFGHETQGATLALDIAQHEIVLSRALAVESSTAASFAAAVESFVNAAEQWQQRLASDAPRIAPIAPMAVMPERMQGFLRG